MVSFDKAIAQMFPDTSLHDLTMLFIDFRQYATFKSVGLIFIIQCHCILTRDPGIVNTLGRRLSAGFLQTIDWTY